MHRSLPFWDLTQPPSAEQRTATLAFLDGEIDQTGEIELRELSNFVRAGDLVVDVGANIGIYSRALSRLGASVVAFEPQPAFAQMLEWMKFPGVDVRRFALAGTDRTATLTFPDGETDLATLRSKQLPANASSLSVSARPLDQCGLNSIRFIKIDVEGFEEEVLAGALATIHRDRPTLLIEIEERHNVGGLARITNNLALLGYSGFYRDSGAWCDVEDLDPSRDQNPADLIVEGAWIRSDIRYINNFLFVQHPNAALIDNAQRGEAKT